MQGHADPARPGGLKKGKIGKAQKGKGSVKASAKKGKKGNK